MPFLRLQELAAAKNSNNLTDALSVYIQRQINANLQFAVGLSHLYEVLYSKVHEHRLLIAELNVFGDGDDDVGLYLLCFYIDGDDDVR
ncbi:hypothetical protein Tco_0240174 [Tanacetum coccineum]